MTPFSVFILAIFNLKSSSRIQKEHQSARGNGQRSDRRHVTAGASNAHSLELGQPCLLVHAHEQPDRVLHSPVRAQLGRSSHCQAETRAQTAATTTTTATSSNKKHQALSVIAVIVAHFGVGHEQHGEWQWRWRLGFKQGEQEETKHQLQTNGSNNHHHHHHHHEHKRAKELDNGDAPARQDQRQGRRARQHLLRQQEELHQVDEHAERSAPQAAQAARRRVHHHAALSLDSSLCFFLSY